MPLTIDRGDIGAGYICLACSTTSSRDESVTVSDDEDEAESGTELFTSMGSALFDALNTAVTSDDWILFTGSATGTDSAFDERTGLQPSLCPSTLARLAWATGGDGVNTG